MANPEMPPSDLPGHVQEEIALMEMLEGIAIHDRISVEKSNGEVVVGVMSGVGVGAGRNMVGVMLDINPDKSAAIAFSEIKGIKKVSRLEH